MLLLPLHCLFPVNIYSLRYVELIGTIANSRLKVHHGVSLYNRCHVCHCATREGFRAQFPILFLHTYTELQTLGGITIHLRQRVHAVSTISPCCPSTTLACSNIQVGSLKPWANSTIESQHPYFEIKRWQPLLTVRSIYQHAIYPSSCNYWIQTTYNDMEFWKKIHSQLYAQ